jgi:hypothetical protein
MTQLHIGCKTSVQRNFEPENFIYRGMLRHGTFQNSFSLVSTLTIRRFPIKAARSSRLHHYRQALNS